MADNAKRYLLICNTSDGLVAQLNGIIIQLQLARRLGYEPIVYLHERSYMFGGPNPYFDAGFGPNIWDYFFEPIGVPPAQLQGLIKAGQVFTLTTAAELERLYRWDPESWFMNPFGYYRSVENKADGAYPTQWWHAQREKARLFLRDGTVQFKPFIQDLVNRFAEQNFSDETLGLQLRGSDKFDFGVGANLARKVLPQEYFPHIDKYLASHPKCSRIFVATDQRQWVAVLEKAYPGKIVSYSEKSLSDGDENSFNKSDEKSARGIEVFVDVLLLSRCNHILKCHSAVGEMALVINPKLEFLDLNYATQPYDTKTHPLRPVFVTTIKLITALWKNRAQNGAALANVVALNHDQITVDSRKPRNLNNKPNVNQKAPNPPITSKRFQANTANWINNKCADKCFKYLK